MGNLSSLLAGFLSFNNSIQNISTQTATNVNNSNNGNSNNGNGISNNVTINNTLQASTNNKDLALGIISAPRPIQTLPFLIQPSSFQNVNQNQQPLSQPLPQPQLVSLSTQKSLNLPDDILSVLQITNQTPIQ